MRILFVLENYYPNIGGVETLFKSLADELVDKGYELTIITNKNIEGLPFREEATNLKILRFPFSSRYIFTAMACFPAIYYAFKSDLIHTTSYNAGIPAYVASLVSRKKVIITFHEVWGKLWFRLPFFKKIGLWLHYIFEKFLLKLNFDQFVAVSDYTHERLIKYGVSRDKVMRIYNGIDYSPFTNIDTQKQDTFRFIYFGRLGISKGLDILMGAVKILHEQGKDFELLLVIPTGPVNLRKIIESSIKEYNIEPRISIKSDLTKDELIKVISESNATVIPSYSEGFCFTAVESIAIGTPVISSGRGALKEVVAGDHLVMTSQDAQGLAQQMNHALQNEWKSKPIKEYHLSDTVKQYMDLYESMRANKR